MNLTEMMKTLGKRGALTTELWLCVALSLVVADWPRGADGLSAGDGLACIALAVFAYAYCHSRARTKMAAGDAADSLSYREAEVAKAVAAKANEAKP